LTGYSLISFTAEKKQTFTAEKKNSFTWFLSSTLTAWCKRDVNIKVSDLNLNDYLEVNGANLK
jgi:hypothetical protein